MLLIMDSLRRESFPKNRVFEGGGVGVALEQSGSMPDRLDRRHLVGVFIMGLSITIVRLGMVIIRKLSCVTVDGGLTAAAFPCDALDITA